MKKFIFGLVIAVGIMVSVHGVSAKAPLSEQRINAVVQILRAFDVDDSKISDIVKILRKDNPQVVAPQVPAKSTAPIKTNPSCTNCQQVSA